MSHIAAAAGATQTNTSASAQTNAGSSKAFKHTVKQMRLRSDVSLSVISSEGCSLSPAADWTGNYTG